MAYMVIEREKISHPDVIPLIILLTDGAGNVSLSGHPPQEEAHALADQIADADIRCVVVNMEHEAFDQGLAQSLAEHLQAPCYTLHELKAETLYAAVRSEIET
jgi:magnesium chelatase subunit D